MGERGDADDGRRDGGSTDERYTRRRLLGYGAVAGALSMAGCNGILGSDSGTPTNRPGVNRTGEPRSLGTLTAGPAAGQSTVTADAERVDEVLGSLSLAEKIGQMTQLEPANRGGHFAADRAGDAVGDGNVGSILFGGADAPGSSAEEALEYFRAVQSTAMDEVGVPLLVGIDAVHGNATVDETVVFPHQIGVGATWNTALARAVGRVTGRSVAATGANWTFAPVADLAYDPRWGRYYECFGEDPHAVGQLVAASVAGIEAHGDGDKRVAATVKHFAGYSMPETGDDREAADVSTRTLRDVVLPPFRDGLRAGAETVMGNSGSVNGVPAHASEWLATTVLRERWGFDGLYVSDWRDIHRLVEMHDYASDVSEAVAMAVNAGVDMYMAPHTNEVEEFQSALHDHVEAGTVSEQRVDEAVRRILRVKERVGLFDRPQVDPESHTAAVRESDRDLARRAAGQAVTLLSNESRVLPLTDVDSILVTGPLATSERRLLGGWTTAWQGAPRDAAPETVTIADGVRAAAPDATVTVVETLQDLAEVADAAADADAVVAALGERSYAEGSGNIDDLSLPTRQRELVRTLDEGETPAVGVMVAGRPRGTPELFRLLDAALMAYLPGAEGGTAVGEALVGERDPAGRLPFTWPRHVGQVPSSVTHRPPTRDAGQSNTQDPLFEFGHGERYDPVEHGDLTLSPGTVTSVGDRQRVTAGVRLANESDRATEEVVILAADYDAHGDGSDAPVVPSTRQVVGFTRADVAAGEERVVELPVSVRALAVTGGDVTGGGERVVPAGEYDISSVGRSLDSAATLVVEETAPLEE